MKNYKEIASIIDKMAPKTRKALSTEDIQNYTGIKLEPFTEIDELVKLQFRKLRGDDASGMKYWYKKYKDQKIPKSSKTFGDILIQVFGPAIKKHASMLENKRKHLSNILESILKEQNSDEDRKVKLFSLADDLNKVQYDYEDQLNDEDLNMLSEFIVKIQSIAKSL